MVLNHDLVVPSQHPRVLIKSAPKGDEFRVISLRKGVNSAPLGVELSPKGVELYLSGVVWR